MNSEEFYIKCCREPSDIYLHLPILYKYAAECNHITEFGVRSGNSTSAFLYRKPSAYRGYDLSYGENHEIIKKIAIENNIDFKFMLKSTIDIEPIENTDLLFIDTYHTFGQLIQELFIHGRQVNKYIIFHDTESYGNIDEGHCINCFQPLYVNKNAFPSFGLLPAINLFMKETKLFKIVYSTKICNGLTVIEKLI